MLHDLHCQPSCQEQPGCQGSAGDSPCTDADMDVHANIAFLSSPNPCVRLRRGRVFPCRGPSALRTLLAVFAALERRQDTNRDAGGGAVHFGCSWRSQARKECAGDSTLVCAVFGNIYARLKFLTSVTNTRRHTTLTELIQFSSGVEMGLFMPG